jgi:2-keto-4-pentenoate hydratase/2-oxohepta-3-ene-1,7-dioic acid hydratase in catechol pathway
MKLVTFRHRGRARIGALIPQGTRTLVLDFRRAEPGLPADMLEFLCGGEPVWALAQRVTADPDERALLALEDVTLLAPVPRPGKLICVGHNYYDHAVDASNPEEYPTFFAKFANTVIGHQQPIVYPRVPVQLDYEAELAVVIGKRAKSVDSDRALEVVAGYTIFNDVTARDYQPRSSRWSIRKSFDTFGPMGPALVTADEIPDPGSLDLALDLNGVQRQHSNTSNLIFPITFLIAYLTRTMTLEPGDVIATGTPSGTGAMQTPPAFMKPGDVVRIRIEGIGELVNPVAAESA